MRGSGRKRERKNTKSQAKNHEKDDRGNLHNFIDRTFAITKFYSTHKRIINLFIKVEARQIKVGGRLSRAKINKINLQERKTTLALVFFSLEAVISILISAHQASSDRLSSFC